MPTAGDWRDARSRSCRGRNATNGLCGQARAENEGEFIVLANERLGFEGAFDWQDNYAAFSVGSELEAVLEYVRNQKAHHASGDLWTEWEETYEEV